MKVVNNKRYLRSTVCSYLDVDEDEQVQPDVPDTSVYRTVKLEDISAADANSTIGIEESDYENKKKNYVFFLPEVFAMMTSRPHLDRVSIADGTKHADTRTLQLDVLMASSVDTVSKYDYVRIVGRLVKDG